MLRHRGICGWVWLVLLAALLAWTGGPGVAMGQLGGIGGGGGGGIGGGGTGGGGTIGTGPTSGVLVDATGLLERKVFPDPTGELSRRRVAEARAALAREEAVRSPLRKISLTRLEGAIRRRLESGEGLTDAMRYLAGVTRVQYVFFYPETRDIVIAGPAEGWVVDLSGRPVGMETGRPVLELQDLAVALRAFPPSGRSTPAIFCSIDPTAEGLQQMQQFLLRVGHRATPADTDQIVAGLRESLGLQTITIGGVSPKTHYAQVLVEADYLMKLIGIGLEKPPLKLTSYVARVNPSTVSRNALTRWYFVPDYECVRVSEDGMAFELVGEAVKLVTEEELVGQGGNRSVAGVKNRDSEAFVREFTQKYAALAKGMPVFAQLRNMIDLAVAAAFIQQNDYYTQAGWTADVLGNEAALPTETLNMPQRVGTAVNSLWKGRRLMTPVGGGVRIEPLLALENPLVDEDARVDSARNAVDLSELAPDQWWWD